MDTTRLNAYRNMWVLVFYDLPTETKKERREAANFRKMLLKDGFTMFQFSIYNRFCPSYENAQVHARRIRINLPVAGKVGIMVITDKQYAAMEIFYGTKAAKKEYGIQQLEFF